MNQAPPRTVTYQGLAYDERRGIDIECGSKGLVKLIPADYLRLDWRGNFSGSEKHKQNFRTLLFLDLDTGQETHCSEMPL